MFSHIYPNIVDGFELKPREENWFDKGVLRFFTQNEFLDYSFFEYGGFYDWAYVYYPNRCIDGTVPSCHLHVVMHGCTASYQLIWDVWVRYSGYIEYAVSNDIVLLFP